MANEFVARKGLIVSGAEDISGTSKWGGGAILSSSADVWTAYQNTTGVVSGSAQLPAGSVSGSVQVDHDATTNFLANEHFTSGSITEFGTVVTGNVDSILPTGTISGSSQLPAGSVSSSIQVDHDATTNFLASEHFTSGSITEFGNIVAGNVDSIIPSGIISGSSQLPAGSVSSSIQVNHDATTNFLANEHFTSGSVTEFGTITAGNVDSILPANTISSSAQFGSGDNVTFGVLNVTEGSGSFSGSFTGDGSNLSGIAADPGTVSGSIQVDHDATTNFLASEHFTSGSITEFSTITTGNVDSILPAATVSGSIQIDHDATTNFAANEHFTSGSITEFGTIIAGNVDSILSIGTMSGSAQLPVGSVSGSVQVDHNTTTNYVAGEHFLQSAITTVGTVTAGNVNNILPAGTISSSLQFGSGDDVIFGILNVTEGSGSFSGSFTGDGSNLSGISSTADPGTVSGSIQVDHNTTTNYVANEHINHTAVSLTLAGTTNEIEITGAGGDITTSRSWTIGMPNDVTIGNNLTVSGTGPHVFGGAVSGLYGLYVRGSFTGDGSSTITSGVFVGQTVTGAPGDVSQIVGSRFASTLITQTATEAISDVAQVIINEPNITNNLTGTITNASTLKIIGVPTEGATNRALWVSSGFTELGGDLTVGGTNWSFGGAWTDNTVTSLDQFQIRNTGGNMGLLFRTAASNDAGITTAVSDSAFTHRILFQAATVRTSIQGSSGVQWAAFEPTSVSGTGDGMVVGVGGAMKLQQDVGRFAAAGLRVQAIGTNMKAVLTLMPSGNVTQSMFRLHNSSDPANGGYAVIDVIGSTARLTQGSQGTGPAISLWEVIQKLQVDNSIIANSGTVSNPSYGFVNSTTTGIYRSAADTIGFSIGGVLRDQMNSNGLAVLNRLVVGSLTHGSNLLDGDVYAFAGVFCVADSGATNIDHLWHDDAGNVWHFVSDAARKADGNSTLRASKAKLNANSSATPSLTFVNDADTGIYNEAANTIGFSASGSLILRIDNTQARIDSLPFRVVTSGYNSDFARTGWHAATLITNNLVYDYANNPDPTLASSWTYYAASGSNSQAGAFLLNKANGAEAGVYWRFYTAPTSTGGGVAPASVNLRFIIDSIGAQIQDGTAANPSLRFMNSGTTGMYRHASNDIGFSAGGAVKFRITTSYIYPYNQIRHVNNGSAAAPSYTFNNYTTTGMYVGTGPALRFSVSSTSRLAIGGTTSAIVIEGSSADEQLRINHTSATGNPYISFYQAGTRRGYIQQNDSSDQMILASEYGPISLRPGSSGTATERLTITNTAPYVKASGTGELLRLKDESATGNPNMSFYQTTSQRAYIQWNDSVTALRIVTQEAASSVEIHTVSALAATFQANGDLDVVGDVTSNNSDIRLKEIIRPIDNVLDTIRNWRTFYYRYNDFAHSLSDHFKDETRLGLAAQDIQETYPEAIGKAPFDEEYLTIREEQVIPVLVAAIKELIAENDKLSYRLDLLESAQY